MWIALLMASYRSLIQAMWGINLVIPVFCSIQLLSATIGTVIYYIQKSPCLNNFESIAHQFLNSALFNMQTNLHKSYQISTAVKTVPLCGI
jgi:hypothetical protein